MAPRTATCIKLVKGRRIRLTALDFCGRPIYSDDSTAVSKGFISVAYTANTTETDAVSVPNAAGELVINEPAETTVSGYSVEISFAEVDPELFSLATGQPVVLDLDGNVIGLDIDTRIEITTAFALELWAGTAAGNVCEPGTTAQGSWGYFLVPFLKGGIVGDFTVENGAVSFTLTGATTREGNSWGVGPYRDIQIGADDLPGPLTRPVSSSLALRTILVDVAPPAAVCGTRPLLRDTAPAVTAVTAATIPGSLDVSFTTTPDDITTPVWYDFGDGTWDYVEAEALGDANHTYEEAGTYVVKASSNGTWVETTITVTSA